MTSSYQLMLDRMLVIYFAEKGLKIIRMRRYAAIIVLFLSISIILVVPDCDYKLRKDVAANTYYVSTSGNDSNPGTLSLPFKTIQKGVNVAQPGDTVLVRAGTYLEKITMQKSGTSSAKITVKNYPGENPVINGENVRPTAVNFNGKSHIKWEGFELTNHGNNTRHTGVFVLPSGSAHIEIMGNYVHHNYGGTTQATSLDGIRAYRNAAGPTLIEDNRFEHMRGRGMYIRNNFTARGNTFINTLRDAIYFGWSTDCTVLIEKNYFQDIGTSPDNMHDDAIQSYGNLDHNANVTIRYNIINRVAYQGIILEEFNPSSKVVLHDNLLYGGSDTGNWAILIEGITGGKFFNNTVIGNWSGGIGLGSSKLGRYTEYCYAYNNLAHGVKEMAVKNTYNRINYIGNNVRATNESVFVNASANDYRLSSVATDLIDKGYANMARILPYARVDLDEKTRVINGRIDIGAYEYGAKSGTDLPADETGSSSDTADFHKQLNE